MVDQETPFTSGVCGLLGYGFDLISKASVKVGCDFDAVYSIPNLIGH